MAPPALILLLGATAPALAGPHLISDPSERTDITHCGIYRGGEARVLSPAAKDAAGRPYCRHDLASWAPGSYSVTATFVIAGPPEQESARSDPLTVTIQPGLAAPQGLRLGVAEIQAEILPMPAQADISAEGTTDWVHWGLDSASSVNRKAGAALQIGALTGIGGTPARHNNSAMRTGYTWTGGTPTASATTHAVLYTIGLDKGFELQVPADTTLRTLVVYLGGWKSSGRVTASLSDGSAPDSVQTVEDLTNTYDRRLAFTYRAGSAGQTLLVRYIQVDGTGNVSLQAATLAGAP